MSWKVNNSRQVTMSSLCLFFFCHVVVVVVGYMLVSSDHDLETTQKQREERMCSLFVMADMFVLCYSEREVKRITSKTSDEFFVLFFMLCCGGIIFS